MTQDYQEKLVNLDTKRRCPHCQSNKWKWVETLPTSVKTIGKYLLMRYECENCGKRFLADERAKAKLVSSAERCFRCNSRNIALISKPDADIDLYFCRQCHCYMRILDLPNTFLLFPYPGAFSSEICEEFDCFGNRVLPLILEKNSSSYSD